MWLMAIGLTVGAVGVSTFISRHRRSAPQPDLGWMSQQWLAEHRYYYRRH